MDDMLKDFVVEALELATNVEEHLLTLERNPGCLLYTSPSPRDLSTSRMPSSA